MTPADLKHHAFVHFAAPLHADEVRNLAARLGREKAKGAAAGRAAIAGKLARTAFLEPDRIGEIYDALTLGWSGQPVNAPPLGTLDRLPGDVPPGLLEAWWSVAEDIAAGKLDALAVTQRSAALGGLMPKAFQSRVAKMSYLWPGVAEIADRPLPEHVRLEDLAVCPPGSLGRAFHDLIVDNKFDLEVLDREAIGLAGLPKPLDYLNTRILQSHDLWHITAGYETTSLHELAISAFQMAQFGHAYSAQFLSVSACVGALAPGFAYPILMDTMTSAWAHGRETPPLMLIEWESLWHQAPDAIRAAHGIRPYVRPWRADIAERRRPLTDMFAALRRSLFAPARSPA